MPHPAYLPDDAKLTVAALEALHSDSGTTLRTVLANLANPERPTVAEISNLRKTYPADLLHAGLTLAALQAKGRAKFPELPYIWATPEALEQSSGSAVARHKASRFHAAGVAKIMDLCCGIGGDTLALAAIAPVVAVDLSAVRTTCLRFNLQQVNLLDQTEIQTGDVNDVLPHTPQELFFHIDPARRHAGEKGTVHRSPRYEDLIPGPDILEKWIAHSAGGAIKLSPAVDFASLPAGHIELITHAGTVVQAVLWTGRFRESLPPNQRTATILGHSSWSFQAAPEPVSLAEIPSLEALQAGGFFYELDGAVTRANLAAPYAKQNDLQPLTPDGGYLFAPRLLSDPAITPFKILQAIPFSEARVSAALAALPKITTAPIEVKTRGGLPGIDTDHLQRLWSRHSPTGQTVLLFKHQADVAAVIAQRAP